VDETKTFSDSRLSHLNENSGRLAPPSYCD